MTLNLFSLSISVTKNNKADKLAKEVYFKNIEKNITDYNNALYFQAGLIDHL